MKNKILKISMSIAASTIMFLSFNGDKIEAKESESFIESSLKGLKGAQFAEIKLTDDKNKKAKELSTTIQNSLSMKAENLEKKIEIVDELNTGNVIEVANKLEKANITTFVETNEKTLPITQKEKLLSTESLSNSSLKNSEKIIPLSTKDSLFKNLSSKKEIIIQQELEEKNRLETEKKRLAEEAEKKRIEEEKTKKEASKKNYYTTHSLNVRSNPSLDAEIFTTFEKEYNFEAYPHNEEWLEIRYQDKVAYIAKKYAKEGTMINTSKKVQSAPSVSTKSTNGNKIYNLTAYEKDLLERLVQAEAGNQPYEGRVAVATVVANRIEFNGSFANNVKDVIYAKNQFSPTMNGMIDRVTPSAETKKAVEEVFLKGQRNLPSNVVYFCTNEIRYHSWINTRAFHSVIGDHSFFYNYSK